MLLGVSEKLGLIVGIILSCKRSQTWNTNMTNNAILSLQGEPLATAIDDPVVDVAIDLASRNTERADQILKLMSEEYK